MKRKRSKKALSLALAIMMVLSVVLGLVPATEVNADGAGGGYGQIITTPSGYKYRAARDYVYFDHGGWDDSTMPGSGTAAHQPQMPRGGSITEEHLNWWVDKMEEEMIKTQAKARVYTSSMEYLPDSLNGTGQGLWSEVKETIRSAMKQACDRALENDPQGTNARIIGVAWEYCNPGDYTSYNPNYWYLAPTGWDLNADNDFHTLFGGSPSNHRYPDETDLSASVGWDSPVDVNNDGVYLPNEIWRNFAYDLAAANQPASNRNAGRIYFIAVTDNQPKKQKGFLQLKKSSSKADITEGNSCYSLIGATYEIYDNENLTGSPVATLVVADAAGNTNKVELSAGTYWFKETRAGTGYSLKTFNAATDKIEVTTANTENNPAIINTTDVPVNDPQSLSIRKASAYGQNKIITDSSATFKVDFFANPSWSGTPARTWYYKTINGYSYFGNSTYLDTSYTNSPFYYNDAGDIIYPLGTIKVTEVKAPSGYLVSNFNLLGKITQNSSGNAEFTWVSGTTNGKLVYESDGTPSILDPSILGGVKFKKVDKETGGAAQGSSSLAGAEISIYNNSGKTITLPDGTDVANGGIAAVVATDANGNAQTSNTALPSGSYYARETKAPQGYALNSSWRVDFTIATNEQMIDKTSVADRINEAPIRADLSFQKVDIDGTPMANIPFLVSRLDEEGNKVESHVIVTDANGRLNTANRPKTGDKVNSLDNYYADGKFADDSKLDGTTGIWFGDQSAREDGKGSLIYANYLIEELSCSANAGQDASLKQYMLEDSSRLAAEFTDGKLFTLNAIFINLEVQPESELLDVASGSKIVSIGTAVKVQDEVRWNHLKKGQEYKLKTVIYSENPVGTYTKIGENTVSFTPSGTGSTNTVNGKTVNTITLDTSNLNGGKLHAVDFIYAVKDGKDVLLVSHNEDYTDDNQWIGIPSVATFAIDKDTQTQVGTPKSDAEIIDTVVYENFPDRGTFIVEATARYADTGEAIASVRTLLNTDKRITVATVDADGTINAPLSGTFTMPGIKLDATALEGRTVVITETFTDKITKEEFVKHYDLGDENQSIHYIKVETVATDEATGSHTGVVIDNDRVLDEVKLSNLIIGEEYTVTGQFFRKDTMELLAESSPVTIIAASTEEYVYITFELDSSSLAGVSAVAFEYVTHNDIEVGKHEDPDDVDQTVNYPDVKTTAVDGTTGTNTGDIDKTTIVDTVELTNLTVGNKYKVVGTVMNEDGTVFVQHGEALTKESDIFTADNAEMAIEIVFDIDSMELMGTKKVVFEKLYFVTDDESNEVLAASHEEISDANQTITYPLYVPRLGTVATDKADGDKFIASKEGQAIVDTVYYDGLVPNKEYEMVLTVYDKTDEKLIDGLEARKTFTSSASGEGTVKVEIEVNGEELSGHLLVMFEEAYRLPNTDEPIAEHKNPDDKEQTIGVPVIRTVVKDSKTGEGYTRPYWENEVADTVIYEGLIPGLEYELFGRFVSKASGEETEITGSTKFTPSKSNGEIEVPFTFDGTKFEGSEYVAFEELKYNGKTIAEHKDLEDVKQLLKVGAIGTIEVSKDFDFPNSPGGEEKTPPPSTGDNSNIVRWTVLFFSSLMLLAIGLEEKLRKRRRG